MTDLGRTQAHNLGSKFRTLLYPGEKDGVLRLHATYRHDLKIYASDEGRVQMSAAAFTKVWRPTCGPPAHGTHGTRTARARHAHGTMSACLSARWSKRLRRRSRRGCGGGGISMPRWRAPRWREISTRPSVAAARVSGCSTCCYRGLRASPRLGRAPCGEGRVAWAQARRVLQSPRRSEPRGRAHTDNIIHAGVVA